MRNMMIIGATLLLAACHAPHTAVGQGVGTNATNDQRDQHSEQLDREAYRACVDKLAAEAEPAVLAHADEILAGLLNDHMADKNSYHLELNRFGDFLQIAVERGGVKYATAVNLGRVSEVREADGRPPDGAGTMSFKLERGSADADASAIKCTDPGCSYCVMYYAVSQNITGVYAVSKNITGVFAVEPEPPKQRETFAADPVQTCYSTSTVPTSGSATSGMYITSNLNGVTCGYAVATLSSSAGTYAREHPAAFPRVAEDDVVSFIGIGTLHAPAGLGAGVLEAVLTEIGEGYAPKQR